MTIQAEKEDDWVCLRVADDGNGIAQEHQGKVFTPFFTTRLGKGGSGLGLHIVHTVVTRVLGGTVTMTSEQGHGTTFTLRLPGQAPELGKQASAG